LKPELDKPDNCADDVVCQYINRDFWILFCFEGVIISALGFMISAALSIPLSLAIGDTFGGIFLQTPLDNVLNLFGYVLWLIIIMVITALVGLGVSLKALEIPVNEILNYEL